MSSNPQVSESSAALNRHIWMVSHYAPLPSKDGGSARHLKLSEHLPNFGWTSSLIVASTKHPEGSQALFGLALKKITVENGVKTLWIRTNRYGSNLQLRFLGMILFAVNLLRPGATRGLPKPDLVLGSTVHPFAAWAGYRLAKRHRVPFVYEIQDVWPETLHGMANIGPRHPVSRVFAYIDATLIRRAALVLSPLPFVDKHLSEVGYPNKPFLWVSNGADIPERSDDLPDRRQGPFTFMYLGSHGVANALEDILTAFDRLCFERPDLDLQLRLVGDGPRKRALISEAANLSSADRIFFEDWVPETEVLHRAHQADCLVVNMHDLPLYRFGVSLNKYFMYLSADRPIVAGSSAPNNPVRESGAGLVVPGGAIDHLATAMLEVAELPYEVRAELAARGRVELENNYSHEILARRLAEGLDRHCFRDGGSEMIE